MASVAEKSTIGPHIGLVLDGEFRVEERLGTGGMGTVYRAIQEVTERSVAVKVLHPHLCDEEMIIRFRREAQIISRLGHPNIITVHKCGQLPDGTLYIAMEYVPGRGLGSVLEPGRPMARERALPLMIQMADALAYAHEQKVIHRDIKPENIIVTRAGRSEAIKVLDFGIAKIVDGNATLTKAGALYGSPPYMAPEQWQQVHDVDGRADIYALGSIFYEMITGGQPFHADSVMGYMCAHLQGGPRPIARSALGDIVMKCIQRDRSDRFADAYELVEALEGAWLDVGASRRARASLPSAPALEEVPRSSPRPVAPRERSEEEALLVADVLRTRKTPVMVPPPMGSLVAQVVAAPPTHPAPMPASLPAQTVPAPEPSPGDDDRTEDQCELSLEEEQAKADRLRAITREFQGRGLVASSSMPPPDRDAARMHLVFVLMGGVLCTALALALVLLR